MALNASVSGAPPLCYFCLMTFTDHSTVGDKERSAVNFLFYNHESWTFYTKTLKILDSLKVLGLCSWYTTVSVRISVGSR